MVGAALKSDQGKAKMSDAAAHSRSRPAQDRFARDRFVVLRAPFPDATEELRAAITVLDSRAGTILERCDYRTELIAELAKTHPHELIVVPEQDAPHLVCRYEYILGASDQVRDFETRYIRPLVAGVVGRPLSLLKDKMNRKSAGGGAFGPHQDHEAYRKFPPPWYVTAMVAIDEATEANGCLQFAVNFAQVVRDHPHCVAGWDSENPLLRAYQGGPRNGAILDEVATLFEWRPIPARAGDVVIFDSFIPHRSEINRSPRSRRALFLTYNTAGSGDWYDYYYRMKRARYDDPMFHVGTPTAHAGR
jgi:ectoine hydroxylase-related dioxygenase (phytanoyl-CoA dioxygenase family)